MTVVTFRDYRPIPREGGGQEPWSQAVIEEGLTATGPWTVIDAVDLVPLDQDPESPQARDFTTEHATLTDGWYRVTFVDATGDQTAPTAAVQNVADPLRPSADDVAALLHARTAAPGGRELGTFTDATRPSADEVERMIDMAASIIATSIGTLPTAVECPDAPTIASAVVTLTTMRAAMMVEASLWPEQITTADSPYATLREQYEAELPRVVDAAHDCRQYGRIEPGDTTQTGGTGGEVAPPADAAWGFTAGPYDVVQW